MAVDRRRLWRLLPILTVALGAAALLVMWYGMNPTALPPGTLTSDARVEIVRGSETIDFRPRPDDPARAGLIFFPGGMVDPDAYAPMARALASQGHPVVIVRLPYRMAPARRYQEMAFESARNTMAASPRPWVIGGHARGAMLASRFAAGHAAYIGGLALIATAHPRDVDLSGLPSCVPVLKVYGSRDPVADAAEGMRYRSNLPPHAVYLEIEGGNHAQFGYYRFRPGDGDATISREAQHEQMVAGLLGVLRPAYPGLPAGARPPCQGHPAR